MCVGDIDKVQWRLGGILRCGMLASQLYIVLIVLDQPQCRSHVLNLFLLPCYYQLLSKIIFHVSQVVWVSLILRTIGVGGGTGP